MKKKAFIAVGVLVVLGIIGYLVFGGDDTTGTDSTTTKTDSITTTTKVKPLNLSVFLDLSDRLERGMTPSQSERDIAIVEYLAKMFKDGAVKKKILPCNDRIKVFFYPAPQIPKVALLSDKLELDLSKTELPKMKVRLRDFEAEFKKSLEQIYQSTLNS